MIFDWDDANRNHIARHNVLPEEVEQLFHNDPLMLESYNQNGEERFNLVGETNRGRFLIVAVTWCGDAYRPVTAWDATRFSQARLYAMEGRQSMSQNLEIPVFATEAEEADWWYENRALVEKEFHNAIAEGRAKQGVPIPPSQRRIETVITLDPIDSKKAHAIAAKRGLKYETYLEMLVHQELEHTSESIEFVG